MSYLDPAPTRPIPLASWHGTKGRNRGCGRKTSGAAPHRSPDSGCGRTRSGDCHSLNIGTYVLSGGLLLSFKLFEKQMAGEMAGQGEIDLFPAIRTRFFAKAARLSVEFIEAETGEGTGVTTTFLNGEQKVKKI